MWEWNVKNFSIAKILSIALIGIALAQEDGQYRPSDGIQADFTIDYSFNIDCYFNIMFLHFKDIEEDTLVMMVDINT